MVPKTRYAKTPDGGYVAYKVLGEGPPDVAVVGSIPTNIEVFFEYEPAARFWLELASFSRLILHDRRGTGLSDDMGGWPNLETRAADLLAVLDAVGSSRPTIVAAGDGGMVAALLAATHPERVASLVWSQAQARAVRAPGWPYGRTPNEIDALAQTAEEGWGSEAFVEHLLGNDVTSPETKRFLAKMQRHACGPATAVGFFRLFHEYDVRHVLPSLSLPVLILAPAGDRLPRARATAAMIPGAAVRALPADAIFLWHASHIDAIRSFLGVEQPPGQLDRILSTVLFTDIVESTAKAAALGDARWKALLAQHDQAAREEITRHRGRFIHTTGDGLLAIFDGPARAVRCAQGIANAVRSLGLEIRAGCHTGEIELAGNDVLGIAVNISARIASLADSSGVLVSSTVKDLVAGSGLAFEDRGMRKLRGVPDEWHLYAVIGVAP
jgi:class 3 adenylate cyclase